MNKPLLQKLSLSACSIALTLLFLECAVRMAGYDPNESKLKRFDSMLGWTIDPAGTDLDNVNGRGFRFGEINAPKSEKTRRILLLGDSFSQGIGLPYGATYAGFLEHHLNAVDTEHEWELINLSVGGWGTAQELLALRELGLDYEPDVIILQSFPYNDLCNNTLELAYTCATDDIHRPYMVLHGDKLRLRYVNRLTFLRRSRLFALIENRWAVKYGIFSRLGTAEDAEKRQAFLEDRSKRAGLDHPGAFYGLVTEEHQPAVVREGWRVTERLLEEVAETAADSGIPLISMVIPYERTFDHEWRKFRRGAKNLNLQPDYGTRRFEQTLAGSGAQVLSVRRRILESDLPPDDYYSPDGHWYDRHLNRFGNHRVTGWLIDELIEAGVVGEVPRPSGSFEGGDLVAPRAMPLRRVGFWGRPGVDWTAGLGEGSEIVFYSERPRNMVLDLAIESFEKVHRFEVEVNGEKITKKTLVDAVGATWKAELLLDLQEGRNSVRFIYGLSDERQKKKFVMCFRRLVLRPAEVS